MIETEPPLIIKEELCNFTIEKSKLSMKILKLLNSASFVYGGFVRDFLIRREEFNDLDLFIKNCKNCDDSNEVSTMIRNEFERKLTSNQIEIISTKNNRETIDYVIKFEQDLLELNVIYENIDCDVPDFDVNNLKFQNGIISQRIVVGNCTVSGIVENIKKKQCILLDETLFEDEKNYYIRRRIKKMQKKGWKIINIPCND